MHGLGLWRAIKTRLGESETLILGALMEGNTPVKELCTTSGNLVLRADALWLGGWVHVLTYQLIDDLVCGGKFEENRLRGHKFHSRSCMSYVNEGERNLIKKI